MSNVHRETTDAHIHIHQDFYELLEHAHMHQDFLDFSVNFIFESEVIYPNEDKLGK